MPKYDLQKTQFLTERGRVRAFRRRRVSMLLDGEGRPLRPMTWKEFRELQVTWPEHVAREGLTLSIVWTLEEITA